VKELVTTEQAEHALRLAALLLPLAGVLAGALVGVWRRRLPGHARVGLLVGLSGPAAWLLWRMYNEIEDRFGLDSVKGLLVNLALFAAIGTVAGIAVGGVLARRRRPGNSREPVTPVGNGRGRLGETGRARPSRG
jgi:hypothetical protein